MLGAWCYAGYATVCRLEEFIAARARAVSFPPPKNTEEFLRSKMWLIWMKMTTIFLSSAYVAVVKSTIKLPFYTLHSIKPLV